MVHVLLKPGLKDFEHYFASMWDEYNCAVVWTFFGIAFLWDWNENWPFPVLWPLLSFQISWHIECSTFTASSFRIWNNSAGIPSAPLALLVVTLPKAHLTSRSRMSGSRWVIKPSWLSGSLRPVFVQFFCVFFSPLLSIFCFCEVRTISVLYFAHFCMYCSLVSLIFLKRSLFHSIVSCILILYCILFFLYSNTWHIFRVNKWKVSVTKDSCSKVRKKLSHKLILTRSQVSQLTCLQFLCILINNCIISLLETVNMTTYKFLAQKLNIWNWINTWQWL